MSTKPSLTQTDSPERLPLIQPGKILQIDFRQQPDPKRQGGIGRAWKS